jgi:cytochrome c oxidase subunit 2
VPPGAGSPQARAINELLQNTFLICGAILAIVTGLIAYCVLRFRKRDDAEPKQVEGHTRLEIAWTIAPALILIALFALTVRAVRGSDPEVAVNDPDLTVVAHQWWWEVRYKSGAITANEIHIPTGRPLTIRVESADVVHDFWVPDLGRKIDAIPGTPVAIQMQADEPGTYLGACAEYCGTQHAWMRIVVVAEKPDAFDAWERHQLEPALAPVSEAAVRGERIYNDRTCVDCHAISSRTNTRPERVAPDLTHIAERTTLGAGVMNNTPEELKRWLQHPQDVKSGSHMPDVRLNDQEVADVVAYFEELK